MKKDAITLNTLAARLERAIHAEQSAEHHLVFGVGSIVGLQARHVFHRVFPGLQALLDGSELEHGGVACELLVLTGDVGIFGHILHILVEVCETGCIVGHVGIVLIGSLSHLILEERSVVRVDILGQLCEGLLHVVVLEIDTTVDKACAVAYKTLHVLVVECRLHLTLLIGHLVVFLAFVSGLEGIEHCIIESYGVEGFYLASSHLLGHLVAGDGALLLRHFVESQVYQFVVSLGLFSRICQLIDTELKDSWTISGVSEAVKRILLEKNTLFDSLMGKVYDNKPLSDILQSILFGGERIPYNPDSVSIIDGEMYGFVKKENGSLVIANRIFETRIYNYFLNQSEMKDSPISRSGSESKEMFIENGHLQMDKLLKHYVTVFDDIYEGKADSFSEEEGRRRFLLFIRPIINGTGNYYVESRTRNNERMDIVIDYLGERFVVELKIWRGEAYHENGEKQLANYLDHYHLDKGYLLTYSFNKNRKSDFVTNQVEGKTIFEAFV